MTKPSSHYIHGTSPEEQQRLGLMNRLLNEASLRELRLEGTEKVLDVGSGLGELSRMMGRQLGEGRVVCVERSVEQIEAARGLAAVDGEADLVTMREGDALALPLHSDEWGTFDVVHARFLLEHLPDPVAAVRAMVRAARPGGRIILEDDDHEILRLWPEVPRFSALWYAYMRTYKRHGNDPLTGRKLVQFLQQASAQPRRCQWIFFGACSGQDTFPIVINNCVGILEGARAEILEEGVVSEAGFGGAIDDLRNWSERRDAAFWFAMAWAEGIRGPDI